MAIIEFYCCDCEHHFKTEPDGSGYDQAPCPKCKLVCMTSEFEGKSTEKEDEKIRMIVVAEFETFEEAEKLCDGLEEAGIEPEINTPDVGADDFFGGGSDLYAVMVKADQTDIARHVIDADSEGGGEPEEE